MKKHAELTLPPLRTHQANRLPHLLRGRAYPTRPVAEDPQAPKDQVQEKREEETEP